MAGRVELILRNRDVASGREVANSPQTQGINETVVFFADFSTWGATDSSPCTSPVITCLDEDDTDVTSTLCTGGGTVVANVQVQFTITGVTAGKHYRIFVKATIDSSIFETMLRLDGER